jgi:hypothetical protein
MGPLRDASALTATLPPVATQSTLRALQTPSSSFALGASGSVSRAVSLHGVAGGVTAEGFHNKSAVLDGDHSGTIHARELSETVGTRGGIGRFALVSGASKGEGAALMDDKVAA